MRHLSHSLTLVLMALLLSVGLALQSSHAADHGHDHDAAPGLVAVLTPTAGNSVSGVVTFAAAEDGVQVTATISGLEPGATHAWHVHEYGDLRAEDGTSLGGHFNPAGHEHGLPDTAPRHTGDLGNLTADDSGTATASIVLKQATLTDGAHALVGRGMIVHAKADDGGQPTGNAGARIAMGVIGYAKPE